MKVSIFNQRVRVYPKLSQEERLRRWLERVNSNTLDRFARPLEMFLPQRLVELLELPNNIVTLNADGSLWHCSRSSALARI